VAEEAAVLVVEASAVADLVAEEEDLEASAAAAAAVVARVEAGKNIQIYYARTILLVRVFYLFKQILCCSFWLRPTICFNRKKVIISLFASLL
jgi:hypothetical protein